MKDHEKRLFFGCEVAAPWLASYPKGRLIDCGSRHLTLNFLGNIPFPPLQKILADFPRPSFLVGPVGVLDDYLFLPEINPRVVAYHLQSNETSGHLNAFQSQISAWLSRHQYATDSRPFLPHVSIARSPFNAAQWEKSFTPLPFIISKIHLYESQGNSRYTPIWSLPLLFAFEEIDHTADLAFLIQAESISSLHLHAQIALAFKYPCLLNYIQQAPLQSGLDDIIMALNRLISQADKDIGCPLKAVSFHGSLHEENGIFKWVMIVDV